jgi:hypothetical protein
MICPNCKSFKNSKFCAECGSPTVKHNCFCGNALTYIQKFCEKCGRGVDPSKKPAASTFVERVIEIVDRTEA